MKKAVAYSGKRIYDSYIAGTASNNRENVRRIYKDEYYRTYRITCVDWFAGRTFRLTGYV